MLSFIPENIYYDLYINFFLLYVLFTLIHTYILKIEDYKNVIFINISGVFLGIFLLIFIGMRPIYGLFGDTLNYNVGFTRYANGAEISKVNDYGWHLFMKLSSSIMTVHGFFTICAFLYIFPLYRVSKAFFKEYWYYAFLMFVVSFSFWTYGVNGVRNGVACSLFLLGLSYRNNILVMILCFLVSLMFHKTLFLPIIAYGITYFYNNPKVFLKIWLICIPLSLVLGGLFISLFASLGFGDERLAGYLTSASAGSFRIDFIFYSGFAVFAGWYFIIKKGFHDSLYNQILNTYLICNSFWILVIRANFSNRFAYLSWFMMAIVIIYPLLKRHFFNNHHWMLGKILFVYFLFTYLMYYVYYF